MKNFDKDDFKLYMDILLKWQKSINLISNNSIPNLWERHFEDSLYLYDYLKNEKNIFDIGSGAGFPGMVLSIAGIKNITFIESDKRKCLFLNEIKRNYNLDVNIINDRVENISYKDENCIIGRAFASVNNFITLCFGIVNKNTKMFLLKGNNVINEIEEAKQSYYFDYDLYKKPDGFILKLSNISKNS